MAPPCDYQTCRAYRLTVGEFERLGGETWTQSFRIRLGLRARELYRELYGKEAPKVRSRTNPAYRNMVGQYPCGILEHAFRELTEKGEVPTAPIKFLLRTG
jgi:hypothetical protein